MESLIAGVRSGANAVYLGGLMFNARRNAGNFDNEELNKAVEYCHQRGVKVYLTLNILVSDDEMKSAYNLVYTALEAGVDAFIVQDIGAAKMIHEHFPTARLHASTQMSIMTPEGVEYAKQLGFSRVVLPREMSLDEIREIRESTDIELELFVHGALCMCVSGQCYMSSMLGSRSGNRGLCAQTCRLPFTARGNKGDYALSLKDLSLVDRLAELEGITSLKIEGRMKRPEYVSAAVTAVKKAISGTLTDKERNELNGVFSRSGFTDGYLTGRTGASMFGARTKEDVLSAKGVLKDISRSYNNEQALVPVNLHLVCKANTPVSLTACALGKQASITGDIPETAINKPMTEETLLGRLSKLGGTQFFAEDITVELDDGLILSAAKINELRRKAVEALSQTEKVDFTCKPFTQEIYKQKNSVPYYTASFLSARQIPDRHPFKYVFIPIDSTLEDFIDNRAGVLLPRGLFGQESKIRERLLKLKKAGVRRALCGNLGSYRLCEELGFEVFGDFGLNIYNTKSAKMIKNPILSFELTLAQANSIDAENTGVIAYGRVPLMLTRNCPVKAQIGCRECNRHGELTDRKGYKFSVICSSYPCVEILNSVPIYMLDRMNEIKTDFAHFYFSTESEAEVAALIDKIGSREKPSFQFTRGLYQRGTI